MPLLTFDPASIPHDEEIPTKEQIQLENKCTATDRNSLPPRSPILKPAATEKQISSLLSKKRPKQSQKRPNSNKKVKLEPLPLTSSPDSDMDEDYEPPITTTITKDISEDGATDEEFDEHHRNLLMNIFLSDNPDDTPSALASTLLTNDINIDLIIDEQGHTALHWAAALGRTKIVDLLISAGANVCSVNFEGETPLMRAAMITCCFEKKCFAHMVEMMSDAVTVFDKKGRTILHHISLTSDVDGYEEAAIYYMKRLFKTAPKKIVLKNMLNIQDRVYGETALAIALRAGCPEIADFLTKQGAVDPLSSNLEPDQALEYIPVDYKQQSKAQDIIHCKCRDSSETKGRGDTNFIYFIIVALHNQIVEMEDQYHEQLRQRDIESFQTKKEMNMLRYQLNEAQRRLELPVSMQLAEAQKRIHELEQQQQKSSSSAVDDLVIANNHTDKSNSQAAPTSTEQEDEENTQPEKQPTQQQQQSAKERKLEKKVKSLQNQLENASKLVEKLKSELETTTTKSRQKEMEYRRLIAASCNLPIEKVDGLIGPLTLAIESDPPDLDMARVIGFMERLRRQGSAASGTGGGGGGGSNVNSPRNSNNVNSPRNSNNDPSANTTSTPV